MKTYLNAAWHARYGSSVTWFEGMNYPYPEHIVAATELPGLAIVMQWLTPLFPTLPDYVFGATHLLLLVSLLLCIVLMYLIFRELGLPDWYAIPVAVGIAFLAPQQMRMIPHMGLAPLFVVPAVLYGLLRSERRLHWGTSAFLATVVFTASMMHFYFFAITVFTITLYCIFTVCRSFDWRRAGRWAGHYALMVGVPLFFFLYWMILSDMVSDRTQRPAGFFSYHAKWESIFLSMEMPLYKWIDKNVFTIEKTDFEGWAYIGMVPGLFILAIVIRWVSHRLKKPMLGFFPAADRRFLWPLLWTGIVLAFFSCSQPFATKGLEFLLEYAGPIRQFRSTGRFAWVFYFVINTVAFAGLFHWATTWRLRKWATGLLILSIVVLFYEVYHFHESKHNYAPEKLRDAPDLLPGNRYSEIKDIDYDKYQAILPVPYYNVGSDNFFAPGQSMVIQQSLVLSYQTGLPLTGAMLTRSSRRQAFDQLQLVTEPYRLPAIFKDYRDDRPLLMIYSHLSVPEELHNYDHLLEESTPLHKTAHRELYEVDLASFGRRIEQRKNRIREAVESGGLFPHNGFLSTDSLPAFVFLDFDEMKSERRYLGDGAFEGKGNTENLLYQGPIPHGQQDALYHLLVWVYVDEDKFSDILFRVRQTGPDGQKIGDAHFSTSFQAKVFDPNGWVLLDCPFQLRSEGGQVQVFFTLKNSTRPLFADEMLILPDNVDLYRPLESAMWWNNRSY